MDLNQHYNALLEKRNMYQQSLPGASNNPAMYNDIIARLDGVNAEIEHVISLSNAQNNQQQNNMQQNNGMQYVHQNQNVVQQQNNGMQYIQQNQNSRPPQQQFNRPATMFSNKVDEPTNSMGSKYENRTNVNVKMPLPPKEWYEDPVIPEGSLIPAPGSEFKPVVSTGMEVIKDRLGEHYEYTIKGNSTMEFIKDKVEILTKDNYMMSAGVDSSDTIAFLKLMSIDSGKEIIIGDVLVSEYFINTKAGKSIHTSFIEHSMDYYDMLETVKDRLVSDSEYYKLVTDKNDFSIYMTNIVNVLLSKLIQCGLNSIDNVLDDYEEMMNYVKSKSVNKYLLLKELLEGVYMQHKKIVDTTITDEINGSVIEGDNANYNSIFVKQSILYSREEVLNDILRDQIVGDETVEVTKKSCHELYMALYFMRSSDTYFRTTGMLNIVTSTGVSYTCYYMKLIDTYRIFKK